jgi:hypothetical protein
VNWDPEESCKALSKYFTEEDVGKVVYQWTTQYLDMLDKVTSYQHKLTLADVEFLADIKVRWL